MTARSSAATYTVENGTVTYNQTGQFSNAILLNSQGTSGTLNALNIAVAVSPTNSNFYLNKNSAWTVEWFQKHANVFVQTGSSATYFNIGADKDDADNVWIKQTANGIQSAFAISGSVESFDITTSFRHFAIVSNGSGSISFYIDGTRQGTARTYTDTETTNRRTIRFNIPSAENNTYDITIDELRVSNTARYSGTSFTAPSSAFTDDINTLALFHFDTATPTDDWTSGNTAQLQSTTVVTARGVQTVSPYDDLYPYTWDTVPSDTWDTFELDRWKYGGQIISGSSVMTALGGLQRLGSASILSTSTLSGRINYVQLGRADLQSTTVLSSKVGYLLSGASTMSVTTTTEGTAKVGLRVRGDAQLQSTTVATASATKYVNAASIMSMTSTTQGRGALTLAGNSQSQSTTVLTSRANILKDVSIILEDFATLTANVDRIRNADANIASTSTLSGTLTKLQRANAQLALSTTLSSRGSIAIPISATIASTTTLSADAQRAKLAIASVISTTDLSAHGQIRYGTTANLNINTGLSASATNLKRAQTALASVAELTSRGRLTLAGRADLRANGFLISAGDLRLLDSDFMLMVPSETRQYGVLKENRTFEISSETRTYEVGLWSE